MRIPAGVRAKILRWARHNLLVDVSRQEASNPEINLSGGYVQNEAFVHIDGVDYYLFAKKSSGHVHIQIRALRTLKDLPAISPEEVPADIYLRLEQQTKEPLGWIRRSL